MLNDCYKHATTINAKGEPFPAEPLIMALLLSQHKMINWLVGIVTICSKNFQSNCSIIINFL
jgi:hypothetical protein